jgi:anti-anti-sigma factor
MSISHQDVGENLRHIMITGRLDVAGTSTVEAQLATLAAAKKSVVVDLTSVQFLASIGIRALISTAKAVKQRGGKMTLVAQGGSTVVMSLEASGLSELIPVFSNTAAAEKAALA